MRDEEVDMLQMLYVYLKQALSPEKFILITFDREDWAKMNLVSNIHELDMVTVLRDAVKLVEPKTVDRGLLQ